MLFRSFNLFAASLMTAFLTVSCGGESAPAPSGLAARANESTMTVSWDALPGVEYWLFYGPTSGAPASSDATTPWIGLVGGGTARNIGSPYVISGLVNGTSYSVTINGRTNGGPGGPGALAVSATPRPAGSIWTAGSTNPPGSNDLHAAAFGTVYIAAGNNGAMYSSTDGATWSALNFATSSNLNGASFFSTYKLVGDGGVVLTSPDAATWTPQTSGTTQNLYAIASNNANLNVAVGANGTIITSADAITWTAATNSATTSHLYGVVYSPLNSGTWVAVGAGGTVVESPDGLTWHAVTSNTTADLRGVAYGTSTLAPTATTFVAVGASSTVLTSADGIIWTVQVLPGTGALNAVTFGTQFVAAGTGGRIFTTTDVTAWTLTAAATPQTLYAVARGTLAYLAVGALGTNLLSK